MENNITRKLDEQVTRIVQNMSNNRPDLVELAYLTILEIVRNNIESFTDEEKEKYSLLKSKIESWLKTFNELDNTYNEMQDLLDKYYVRSDPVNSI